MRKIINFSYGYDSNIRQRIKLIKKNGFDGVFIYAQYKPEEYINDIIESGLFIESLHLSYKKYNLEGKCIDSKYVNILWEDELKSSEYLKQLFSEIEFAAKYKIKKVVMHITGGKTPPPISESGMNFIKKVLDKCEKNGITLCLENLRRLDYLVAVFNFLKSDYLKFCFDSGHAHYMTKNSSSFPWDELGKHIDCLHLNDNDSEADLHFPPLLGTINWKPLINTLFFYNGNLNLTLEVRNKGNLTNLEESEFLKLCKNQINKIEKLILRKNYINIENYVKGYPHSYAYVERYVNDGSISGFSKNTTSYKTSPKSKYTFFSLLEYKTNNVENVDFGDVDNYLDDTSLLIHPDLIRNDYFKYTLVNKIKVSPTASGRTLLCIDKRYDPFFIKLAYPKNLGRLVRHLGKEKIESACEVTRLLKLASDSGKLNSKFSFLKEDIGRVFRFNKSMLPFEIDDSKCNLDEYYEYGYLLREFKPYPYVNENEYLIPFFALFSSEYYPGGEKIIYNVNKPLLINIFEKQNKKIDDFLLDDIIFPLYHTYFDALIYAGIELEAHSQNMLLTIDDNFKIKRIVCRDLESAGRDIPLMNYFNICPSCNVQYKKNDFVDKKDDEKYSKYYTMHSFMFDYKLGEYLVSKLIETAHNYYDFSVEELQNRIKTFNKPFIEKLPKDFFPKEWCYYENINFNLENKKRVYIWNENPKYR